MNITSTKKENNSEDKSINVQCRIIKITSKGYLMIPELLNGRPHRFISSPVLPKPAIEIQIASEDDEMQRQIRLNTLMDEGSLSSELDNIENNRELSKRTKKSRISDLYFIYLAKSSRFILRDPEDILPFHSISVLYEIRISECHFPMKGGSVNNVANFIPVYRLESMTGYQREPKITRTFLVRMLSITGEYSSRRSLLSSIKKFDGPLYDEKQLKELVNGKSKKIMDHYHSLFVDHFVDNSTLSLIPLYSLEQLICLTPQQKALMNRLLNDEDKASVIPSVVMSECMWYKIYAGYVCHRLPEKERPNDKRHLSLMGSEVDRIFTLNDDGEKEDINFRKIFCKALWTLPSVRSIKRLAFFFGRDEEWVKEKWIEPYEKWYEMLKKGSVLMETEDVEDSNEPKESPPHVIKWMSDRGKLILSGHIAVRSKVIKVLKHGSGSLKRCILIEGIDPNMKRLNKMIDELNNNKKARSEDPKNLWSDGIFCLCRSFNESKRMASLTGLKSFPFWTVIDIWDTDTHGNPQHFKHVIKGHTFIIVGWARWKMIHLLHLVKVFTYYGMIKNLWFIDPSEGRYSMDGRNVQDETGTLELNKDFMEKYCGTHFDASLKYGSVSTMLKFSRKDTLNVYHEHTRDFPEKLKKVLRYHFDSGENTMAECGIYCIGKKRISIVRSVLNSIFSELKSEFRRNRYICLRSEHFPFGGNYFVVGDRVKSPFAREIGFITALSDHNGESVETVQYTVSEKKEKRISPCARYYNEGMAENPDGGNVFNSPYRSRLVENKFYITTSVEPFENHKECCGTGKKFTRMLRGHIGCYSNADVVPLPSLFDPCEETFHGIPDSNINVLFCGNEIPNSSVVEMLERRTREVFMIFKDRDANGENENKRAK